MSLWRHCPDIRPQEGLGNYSCTTHWWLWCTLILTLAHEWCTNIINSHQKQQDSSIQRRKNILAPKHFQWFMHWVTGFFDAHVCHSMTSYSLGSATASLFLGSKEPVCLFCDETVPSMGKPRDSASFFSVVLFRKLWAAKCLLIHPKKNVLLTGLTY